MSETEINALYEVWCQLGRQDGDAAKAFSCAACRYVGAIVSREIGRSNDVDDIVQEVLSIFFATYDREKNDSPKAYRSSGRWSV